MITLLKHLIYDNAINIIFSRLESNFKPPITDNLIIGRRLRKVAFSWIGHRVTLENVKVLSIKNIEFLGRVVKFESSEPVGLIPFQTEPTLLFVVEDTFSKCTKSDMYFLKNAIAVEIEDILDIEQ